jgi:hypothetical protein
LWSTKSEDYRNGIAGDNALQGTVLELDFQEPTVGDVKFKIKTVRTWCAAELAKVIKLENSGVWLHSIVLFQTSTFISAWRLFSTKLSVYKV